MYSSIIGTTEDRGSIEIDTDPGNLCVLTVATGRDPVARQKYARASILNQLSRLSASSGLYPSTYAPFCLMGGHANRGKKRSHQHLCHRYFSHPPPTNRSLSLSLCCHRGAAVRRPMDRFMVGAGSLLQEGPLPFSLTSHQTPQFYAAVKDFCLLLVILLLSIFRY